MRPLKLLNEHCTFNSPYEVYVLFAISRKKENDCTGGQEKVFREVIKREEDIKNKYMRLKKSALAYRDEDGNGRNFYIYISVNPRDTRKAFFQMQKDMLITSEELSKQVDVSNKLNRIDRRWLSCLMQPTSRAGRGKFLFDIDIKDAKESFYRYIEKCTRIHLKQETKNGFHLVVEPFDRRKVEDWYKKELNDFYEIKTDALLFVEWLHEDDIDIGIDYAKGKDKCVMPKEIGSYHGMKIKVDEKLKDGEVRFEDGRRS